MATYIALLWPSAEDAQKIEAYRHEICKDCDIAGSLSWPVHQSLLYGIEADCPDRLEKAVREISAECEVLVAHVLRPDVFSGHTVYLSIKPNAGILALQRKVRDAMLRAGARFDGYPPLPKPDRTPLSESELANIEQWGSYHAFEPHITLATGLEPMQCKKVLKRAQTLKRLLPAIVKMDRLSIEILATASDAKELGASQIASDTRSVEKAVVDVRIGCGALREQQPRVHGDIVAPHLKMKVRAGRIPR